MVWVEKDEKWQIKKLQNTPREGLYFANEVDLLNVAIFGRTAKEFKIANPTAKGNMRDNADTVELQVLTTPLVPHFSSERRYIRINPQLPPPLPSTSPTPKSVCLQSPQYLLPNPHPPIQAAIYAPVTSPMLTHKALLSSRVRSSHRSRS